MFNRLVRVIHDEATAGVFLILSSIIGLLISNSHHSHQYQNFLSNQVFYGFDIHHTVAYWVNHGLMSIFFLLVGLEVKEVVLNGDLNTVQKAMLPGFAALGGIVLPALLFLFITRHHIQYWRAWAVPVATDIAFSLAVLKLLGKKISLNLKYILLSLACFDDIGAVIIIAVFYTTQIHWSMLVGAAVILGVLGFLNYIQCKVIKCYLLLGAFLWMALSESGVDAAISGIFLAMLIPLNVAGSPATRLHAKLGPWVHLVVVPIFALANVSIQFSSFAPKAFVSPLALGVLVGLVIGKPLGVLSFSWLAIRTRLAQFPARVNWNNFTGMAFICGIGFTIGFLMSELAFVYPEKLIVNELKSAIVIGSLISAVLGISWFLLRSKHAE